MLGGGSTIFKPPLFAYLRKWASAEGSHDTAALPAAHHTGAVRLFQTAVPSLGGWWGGGKNVINNYHKTEEH